ncbi:MAG: RNA polymerase sporulation sigma factor SigE [Clostridia bacterium]
MFKKIISILRRIFFRFSKKTTRINYICGNGALPMPLEAEEERKLLIDFRDGKAVNRDIIVEHNLRLVVYIAKKFENTGVDTEDLISIGTIGLIKAVNSFDIEKNIKLATYASRCIENEILMYLRRISKTRTEISLDEPLNVDGEGNELLLSDILGTDPDIVYKNIENNVEIEMLYGIMDKLNSKEKYILKMRFGLFGYEEMTQKEVADILGISQSYISRLEKKIINKIKREFQKIV